MDGRNAADYSSGMQEENTVQLDLETAVLNHVNHPNYQPVKPRVLAKKLALPKEQIPDVRKAVKRLAKKGKLAYGPKHLVTKVNVLATTRGERPEVERPVLERPVLERPVLERPGLERPVLERPVLERPGKPKSYITGTFRKAAAGFGFARPKDPDLAKKLGEDIYISQKSTMDASNGDLVAEWDAPLSPA